jgi:hypothetical protein
VPVRGDEYLVRRGQRRSTVPTGDTLFMGLGFEDITGALTRKVVMDRARSTVRTRLDATDAPRDNYDVDDGA